MVGEPLRLGRGVTAAAGRDCEEEELLRRMTWIENTACYQLVHKTHTGDAQQSELSLFTDYSGFVSSTHSKQAHWVSKVRYYILPSTHKKSCGLNDTSWVNAEEITSVSGL